jgi:hypothetical protein
MTNSNTAKFGLPFQIGLVCLFATVILPLAHHGLRHLSNDVRPSRHSGARFVFADLDGDRIPDLAQVESQNPRSANTNYSIHVKLSAGVESAIGVSGPMGGLRVAARDVNGDDSLDLVVTSNLDSSFVEVFLNDGHGNFAAAPSANLAMLERVSDFILEPLSGPQRDRVTLASARTPLDEALVKDSYIHEPVYSPGGGARRQDQPVLQRDGLAHLGRSPPVSATFS